MYIFFVSFINFEMFWLVRQCETPKRKKMDKNVPLLKIPSFASDTSSDAGEVRRLLRSHINQFCGNNDQVAPFPQMCTVFLIVFSTWFVVWSCHWNVVANAWANVLLRLLCFRTGPGLSQPCGPRGCRAEVSYTDTERFSWTSCLAKPDNFSVCAAELLSVLLETPPTGLSSMLCNYINLLIYLTYLLSW